jgi:hypothetical protein
MRAGERDHAASWQIFPRKLARRRGQQPVERTLRIHVGLELGHEPLARAGLPNEL